MKSYLLFLLLLFSFSNNAQSCLEGNNLFISQSQIDSFPILFPNCTTIEGNLQLGDFGTDITNFDSLQQLTSIEGDLVIFYNTDLDDLMGLHHLTTIGGKLNLKNNSSITSLIGLENLETIGTDFIINNNDNLVNVIGLEKLNLIGNEMFVFEHDNLLSLTGLENLNRTSGLKVHENLLLGNFKGLDNLTVIDGSFDIVSNDALFNFEGLEKVDSITGNFYVQFNHEITSMKGLDKLKFAGKNFTIRANHKLESLQNLANLIHIQGPGINISNNSILASLSGIDNVEISDLSTVTSLTLEGSGSLSFCSIKSVCDYLTAGGVSFLSGNSFGCNDEGEILFHCNATNVDELGKSNSIEVFPNPTSNFLNISVSNNLNPDNYQLEIWNILGQPLLSNPLQRNQQVNLQYIPNGLYWIGLKDLSSNKIKQVSKFIIKK